MRTTEFAPAISPPPPHTTPASGYAPPHVGLPRKAGRFSGQDFALQPDGTLQCPANQKLIPHEHHREADGSLRIVYGASIRSCRPCPLREQCQWQGSTTAKPRQVSVLLHPLKVGVAPLLWRDRGRGQHRRACIHLLRHQRVEVQQEPDGIPQRASPPLPLSRAERAHSRLSWVERLARHTRGCSAPAVAITLFGVPSPTARTLGLKTV